MKNYRMEALRTGIEYNCEELNKCIQKYHINKDTGKVTVKYMNLYTETIDFSEEKVKELETKQHQDFDKVKRTLMFKISDNSSYLIFKGSIYLVEGNIINYIFGIFNSSKPSLLGTLLVSTVGICKMLEASVHYKLERNLNLVSWIIENKEAVDKTIKEEVEAKATYEKSSINRVLIYPKDLVPYSESMYEEGITLNNIDELSDRQLSKIKRKTLRKERVQKYGKLSRNN